MTAVQDGIGSFYVLGGFVYGPDEVTSAMYRFDEDTYEFVQLEQTLAYPAEGVVGIMLSDAEV